MNLQLVSISNGKFQNESRIYIVRVCVAVNIKESNVSMEIYVRISEIIPAVLILLLLCVMHLGLDGSCWLQYRIESTILMGLNETNTDFQPKASENTYIKKQNRNTRVQSWFSAHVLLWGGVWVCVDMNRTHWISIESHLHFKTFLKTSYVSKWMSTDLPNKIEMDSVTND